MMTTDKRRSYDSKDRYSDSTMDSNGGRSSGGAAMMSNKYDDPPNSRLFIGEFYDNFVCIHHSHIDQKNCENA